MREVWKKNCDGLTLQEQGLMWQLLLEFKDCFSLSEDNVGRTNLIHHNIDTGDALSKAPPPSACKAGGSRQKCRTH